MKINEEKIANQFKSNWQNSYNFDVLKNPVETLIRNIKDLERENMFANEMIMFFDNKRFAPLYITKNIETILGYPQQAFLDWGKDAFLKIGTFEQNEFWKNIWMWQNDFMEIKLNHGKSPTTFRSFCAGCCSKHIDGRRMKFLFRSEYPIRENKVMPDFHFARLKGDIGHLLKKDGYFFYCEKFNAHEKVSKFYSESGTSDYPISIREKEVLKLIANGMNSKEIAAKLFISLETVKTHRKNMISRLRAKDTSSLIQLCKLCEII